MATDWYNPQNISQYSESGAEDIHVQWDESNGFSSLKSANGSSVGTKQDLVHIARSPKPNITNKTYYLKMLGYNFSQVPSTVTGIELKLISNRAGRITDDTVALIYQNQIIGDNRARLDLDPLSYYGGPDDLWGITEISSEIVQDSSFGVLLRFKSHPNWPHSDPIDLISVQLRIH